MFSFRNIQDFMCGEIINCMKLLKLEPKNSETRLMKRRQAIIFHAFHMKRLLTSSSMVAMKKQDLIFVTPARQQ